MEEKSPRKNDVHSSAGLENFWLRMLDIDCKGSAPPWWQAFRIYKEHLDRRTVFRWGQPPLKPAGVYASPLLEAQRYSGILKNDPFVKTQADLAREMGVSRVRITQVMNLLKLAPEVQERLLGLEDETAVRYFSEHRLRALVQIENTERQVKEFQKILRSFFDSALAVDVVG